MTSLLQRAIIETHRQIEVFAAAAGYAKPCSIPADMTFVDWCEELGRGGLEVDGHPFDLSNRPALRSIYEAIPSTKSEGYNLSITIMKGAQTGLTVMSFLLQVYLALKYSPIKVGIYYPDRALAAYISTSRFMPVVRTIPDAYKALLESCGGNEGNVLTRRIGKSEVIFLWTSGNVVTESFPLGAIVADEVQNMLVDDIERIRERMSASDVRFFFACSTAKWPGADIDALYQRGDQRRFHTACRCDDGVVLDEVFPQCIEMNTGQHPGAPLDYVYVCPACKAWIADPQDGEWVPHNPSSKNRSFHFPQTLSPTVSAREVIEAYSQATDLGNFWQRKLGKPWTDPSQVPITLEICERQAEAGMAAGVVWKQHGRGTYLGLDQMGSFIVAIVVERMADGRMAMIHAEFIYDNDPFARCDQLMADYGVAICVVEQLPNVNDARRFANRHRGRVFLAGYADLRDDMMQWGDQLSRSDRRTAEEDRSRYTVNLQQYRTMQAALYRIKDGHCLFPDPAGRQQDVIDRGIKRRAALLREHIFVHFTKVALVVEQDAETRRMRMKVVKIGTDDPHAAYAFMLANVAWARNNGSASIIIPENTPMGAKKADNVIAEIDRFEKAMPGLPKTVIGMLIDQPAGTCGRCTSFPRNPDGSVPAQGMCEMRDLVVQARDPSCPLYDPVPSNG